MLWVHSLSGTKPLFMRRKHFKMTWSSFINLKKKTFFLLTKFKLNHILYFSFAINYKIRSKDVDYNWNFQFRRITSRKMPNGIRRKYQNSRKKWLLAKLQRCIFLHYILLECLTLTFFMTKIPLENCSHRCILESLFAAQYFIDIRVIVIQLFR